MVKLLCAALVAFIGLQAILVKSCPPPAHVESLLKLILNTEERVNDVIENLAIGDQPDSKKLVEILKNNAEILANHVEELYKQLKIELGAHKYGPNGLIREFLKNFTETVKNLRRVAAEATAKAKELKAKLADGLRTTFAQIYGLTLARGRFLPFAQFDLQKAVKVFLEQISELGDSLQSQVEGALSENRKT